MKHAHHNLLLTFAVSVAVLISAVYGYMHHAVSASIARAALARDIVSVEESNKSHGQELMQLYQETVSDRARLSGFFVPANKIVTFIETLESLGPQSGSTVSLSAIAADPLEGAKPGTVGSAHVHVDATGSWASVMKTLEIAEILPYAVSIDHVHIDTSSIGPEAKHVWRLSFDIQASVLVVASSTP